MDCSDLIAIDHGIGAILFRSFLEGHGLVLWIDPDRGALNRAHRDWRFHRRSIPMDRVCMGCL